MFNFPKAASPFILSSSASQASTVTGSAVNLMTNDYEGPMAITQQIGAVTGTIVGKIQDSADGSTGWTDVAGATFTSVGTANNVQTIVVNNRECRGYIRYVGTIVTGPALVSVAGLAIPKTV